MAPEILEGKSQSYTVDWWTLGVLTYELTTGRSPFKHKNDRKLRKLIKKGKFPWPDPEKHKIHLSDDLKDFISKLLTPDPIKRLGAKGVDEIISHSWFKNINFEDVLQKNVKATYLPEIPEVIEENKVMIKSHRKFKKKVKNADQQRDELLETCIGRARQRLIRDYQSKFDATFGCQQ
jgi:serine/threonine protein kinase